MGVCEGVSLKRKCVALSPLSSLLLRGKKRKKRKRNKEKKSLRMRNTAEVGEEIRAHLFPFRGGIFVHCGRPRSARTIEQGHDANDAILQYHIVTLLALLWSPNKDDFVAGWFEFELRHGCSVVSELGPWTVHVTSPNGLATVSKTN